MNRIVHIISLLLVVMQALAQTPVVRAHATADLGNVQPSCIYHDTNGWLWLGAQHAVYRYDGQIFMPIKFPDTVKDATVSALFEWQGTLFAGFQNGYIASLENAAGKLPVPSGDIQEDTRRAPALHPWVPEEGLPKVPITGFCTDPQGALWIATYGEGLYVWKNKRLYNFNQADDGLAGNDIYDLSCAADGQVWAATDAGISICAMPEQGIKKVHNLTKADGLPDELIVALCTDQQKNIWAGTNEKGVFRIHAGTQKIDYQIPDWKHGQVNDLCVFGDHEVWISTEKAGIIWVETAKNAIHLMPKGHLFASAKVRAISKDREGLLWAIADRSTLYSANVRFSFWPTPFSNIQAILSDQSGRMWIGSREGLYVQGLQGYKPALPKTENIVSLWESPSGSEIWAGTLGNGLFILNPAGKVLKHLPEGKSLPNGSILSIAGNEHEVWLATLGGVSRVNQQTLKLDQTESSEFLGSYYVYKVFSDSRGRVWFGTDGNGLVVYDQGKFTAYTEANGLPLRTIYCITEDAQSNIWFSTDRDGLYKFDGQVFKRFTTANHLHSLNITALATNGKGKIIIGYEDGFDILDPSRVDHVNFCGPNNGAPKLEVNLNAAWTDQQGNVWLGNQVGILRFATYLEQFIDDPQPGITGVSTFFNPVDFQQVNTFDYDQNFLQFNFLGLWYSNPDAVRYRYRLEGFDPEWKISKDHTASYPRLPPGNYTFRVQTSEHGNFENVPEASWSFTIRPPFWMQWWFILLAVLTAFTVLAYFVRLRELRVKREASFKREKVLSQFETLKSQINPHFLFNSFNTLITIIEENPKIAVEYVEHLSDFYRSIMVYRERDLISLNEEMELVHTFEFLLKKRYENGFHLIDRVSDHLSGQVMPLSLQILVENAVKHNVISSSKPLTIEIFKENGHVVVKNNMQRKIKPEASTHFGLQSLKNRYQLLGEQPVVVEETDQFFTVKIPLL
ncbi:MAG: histidine kinase [Saprospiraceae bacterium]|nr:histidine kinase [Saprospiraceae bacterium]